jgi:hypothetical protein
VWCVVTSGREDEINRQSLRFKDIKQSRDVEETNSKLSINV